MEKKGDKNSYPLNQEGFERLYIDGGKTIQSFLKENMIDEMIISKIPKTLGDGLPLFENNDHESKFKLDSIQKFSNGIVKYHLKKIQK